MGQLIGGQDINDAQKIAQNAAAKAAQITQLSSADAVDKKVAQLQEADMQQKIAKGISDAATDANKVLNSMLSSMLQPINDAIKQFKTIPPKLRKLVDVEGAKNGMYDQLGSFSMPIGEIKQNMVSSEVPITLEDYHADPSQYENLMAIEYQKNDLTEDDCLSSGYTKVVWDFTEEYKNKFVDLFPAPQDRDIVGKQMEKLIGTTIKAAWQIVQPPIKIIAGIANIGPIPGMVQSVVDSVDAIVKIASMPIPEKMLDGMLAQKTLAQEKAKTETEKAKQPDPGAAQGEEDLLKKAMSVAGDAISQSYEGITAGISESFANFETPAMPDDIKETIEDFKDALVMVKDNIMNIYTIVLLKMMGAVFKCFNQILGVIGVPSIPDPLGKIPQIITDAMKVMEFIMGLPMSLVQCLTAIIKRKMKAVMIAMTPSPPLPLPEKVPVPPTSNDVVKPETSWDDVRTMLVDEYKFSGGDADEIISKLQAFFDGSGKNTPVITHVDSQESSVKQGQFDNRPIFGKRIQFKMTPLYCKSTWLPGNLDKVESAGEGYYYYLRPPVKVSETDWSGKFNIWTAEGDMKLDYDDEWSLLKDYSSGLNEY